MPITELPPVAKSFFTACKKCDADRYHKVLAHSTPTSAKVQCEVCGSKSTYKLPKVVGAPKKPRVVGAKRAASDSAKSRNSHAAEYEKLMQDYSSHPLVDYSMKKKFDLNQRLDHPKFGHGLIRLVQLDKIEVMFKDEVRLLIHNRL